MSEETHFAKELVISECRRVIDLLEKGNLERGSGWTEPAPSNLSELRRKMRELRRDTIRLDRLLYDKRRS